MADSIPSLRRLVNELRAEVRELKSRASEVAIDRVVEKPIYQDNPDHIATIRRLQEKLCRYTSQSDS